METHRKTSRRLKEKLRHILKGFHAVFFYKLTISLTSRLSSRNTALICVRADCQEFVLLIFPLTPVLPNPGSNDLG